MTTIQAISLFPHANYLTIVCRYCRRNVSLHHIFRGVAARAERSRQAAVEGSVRDPRLRGHLRPALHLSLE